MNIGIISNKLLVITISITDILRSGSSLLVIIFSILTIRKYLDQGGGDSILLLLVGSVLIFVIVSIASIFQQNIIKIRVNSKKTEAIYFNQVIRLKVYILLVFLMPLSLMLYPNEATFLMLIMFFSILWWKFEDGFFGEWMASSILKVLKVKCGDDSGKNKRSKIEANKNSQQLRKITSQIIFIVSWPLTTILNAYLNNPLEVSGQSLIILFFIGRFLYGNFFQPWVLLQVGKSKHEMLL